MNDSDLKVSLPYSLELCLYFFTECAAKLISLLFMKTKLCWLANEKTLLLQHLEFYWLDRKGTFP